ncbi:MAG TPA: YggS family pyridoxal phosphate-dependent enzyme [Stellaceae bacterium]|nr:YggS family pyridoxal phosphate-dependent enzyme [Stellaceae bacterium]
MTIADNLAAVRETIATACGKAGRSVDAVTLLAVAKLKPESDVAAALAAGQRVFGENRVQEAAGKYPGFRERWPDLELHLIGPLQTNKARDAVRLFDVIETVDRPRLAEVLAAELKRLDVRTRRLLIQVNTGEEPQKAGVLPAEADGFIRDCIDRLKLPVTGLMCIPPADDEPSLHFALLREMAKRHGLKELSIGMSGDFEIAIGQGATLVRVGTAIFGERA